MKFHYMKEKLMNKKYELMRTQVDNLLRKIDKLVSNFDAKYDTALSNDLHYKLDEVADLIEDNYVDTDFSE